MLTGISRLPIPYSLLVILTLGQSGMAQIFSQPVQFNHQFHIDEMDYSCKDCHVNVNRYSRASLPNLEICADCHAGLESGNPEAAKVTGYISSQTPIPWVQVHTVPDHAFFSHRRHVGIADLDCVQCHGPVEQMTGPFVKPHLELTMEWCLDCHRKHLVSLDCTTCHR